MSCRVGLAYKRVFPPCLPLTVFRNFLHLSGLLDFGAPNPGRQHKACIRHLGGRRPGRLPLSLKVWRLRHQRIGVAEDLLGVSVASKTGCLLAAWRHYLSGFLAGGPRHW